MSEIVLNSLKFRRWQQRVEANGTRILKIDILSVISRQPGTFYAAFLDCLMLTPEGAEIPRCIVIRGESVVIIPVFRCLDDGELYTLMVEQRCICDGGLHLGFPAGNADDLKDDFLAMACGELHEELGIEVLQDELIPLANCGVSINPSITDDLVYFYYFLRDVPLIWLQGMHSRSTGCHGDGEFIRLNLFKLSEIVMLPTSSTLIGLRLLEKELNISL